MFEKILLGLISALLSVIIVLGKYIFNMIGRKLEKLEEANTIAHEKLWLEVNNLRERIAKLEGV